MEAAKLNEGGSLLMLPPDSIHPNPGQPRRSFDADELMGLASSIRKNGLLQPITVRETESGEYELVAGERRLRAAILAGMDEIPCLLIAVDSCSSATLALIENIQRQDLSFFEEAEGIALLMRTWDVTQEEAAARLGMAQSTLANKLRLLRLSYDQREKITGAHLTERHARALLRVDDMQERDAAIDYVVKRQLNVAQTESLVSGIVDPPAEKNHRRYTPLVRDVRLFFNTVTRAVETMRMSGVNAQAVRSESEEYIEYLIRIPKSQGVKRVRSA